MSRLLSVSLLSLALSIPAVAAPELATNNVVTVRGGAPQLLIPAAGHVPGANATLFRSEINIINYTDHAQRVQLRWLPQGGGTFPVVTVTLNPLSGIGAEDFVQSVMQIPSGFGAILVTGVTATDAIDSGARLFATDRIWTFQPGGALGTVSQTFDVLLTSDINQVTGSVSILGLRRDDQYRLNVGIVNMAANPQVFTVTTNGQDATTVTVPALSSQQVGIGGAATANLQVIVSNVTAGNTRSVQWVAYGSSVDNFTGDSWSEIGYVPALSVTQP